MKLSLTKVLHFILIFPSPKAKPIRVDLGFIFGADGVHADRNFNAAKDLAKRMVEKYNISKASALVGGIIYDDSARLLWKLGDAGDVRATVSKIEKLTRSRRGRNLQKALEIARDDLYNVENGARRNIPKTLVIFVDANPTGDSLPIVARELKQSGVKIVVVATSFEVDPAVAKEIASDKALVETPDLARTLNKTLDAVLFRSKPGNFQINAKYFCV